MRSRLRRGYAAVAAMVAVTILLSVSMLTPAISTSEDFSIFNSGWNGTSGLAVSTYESGRFAPSFVTSATGTAIEVVQLGFDEMRLDPKASALVVIGPTLGFTAKDGRIAGDFVREGGVLLLADDFGTGNELLEGMNATSRISGKLVMDLAFDKKPEFSVCYDLRPDPLTRNVSSLLLNYPSSIAIAPATTDALAFSSIASWQDSDGNGDRDIGEPAGPFVMLAREKLGNGTIVILSDPSVLINGMAKYLNNSALDENLIAEISTGRADVFFDESHRSFFDPVAVAMRLSTSVSDAAKGVVVVLAFVLVLWIATDYPDKAVSTMVRGGRRLYAVATSVLFSWRRAPAPAQTSSKGLEEELLARHPSWRPGVLRYVVREHGRHSDAMRPERRE